MSNAYGRAYKRVADEDRLMSAKEIEKLILEKNKEKLRWDSEVCKDAKLTDISSKRLKWFLKEAGHEFHSVNEVVARIFVTTFKRKDYVPSPTQKTTQKIIALIEENPKITRKELAEVTGLTEDGINIIFKKCKTTPLLKESALIKGVIGKS